MPSARLLNMTATSGDLDVVSGSAALRQTACRPRSGLCLPRLARADGVVLEGPVSAQNRVGIRADAFELEGGSVFADTFELAPSTFGRPVTLGSSDQAGCRWSR